jgi:hypothetical protein
MSEELPTGPVPLFAVAKLVCVEEEKVAAVRTLELDRWLVCAGAACVGLDRILSEVEAVAAAGWA